MVLGMWCRGHVGCLWGPHGSGWPWVPGPWVFMGSPWFMVVLGTTGDPQDHCPWRGGLIPGLGPIAGPTEAGPSPAHHWPWGLATRPTAFRSIPLSTSSTSSSSGHRSAPQVSTLGSHGGCGAPLWVDSLEGRWVHWAWRGAAMGLQLCPTAPGVLVDPSGLWKTTLRSLGVPMGHCGSLRSPWGDPTAARPEAGGDPGNARHVPLGTPELLRDESAQDSPKQHSFTLQRCHRQPGTRVTPFGIQPAFRHFQLQHSGTSSSGFPALPSLCLSPGPPHSWCRPAAPSKPLACSNHLSSLGSSHQAVGSASLCAVIPGMPPDAVEAVGAAPGASGRGR